MVLAARGELPIADGIEWIIDKAYSFLTIFSDFYIWSGISLTAVLFAFAVVVTILVFTLGGKSK